HIGRASRHHPDRHEVQQSADSRLSALDDKETKRWEGERAGGSGIHHGGNAAVHTVGIGFDAIGTDVREDVRVKVNQAGGYNLAAGIDDLTTLLGGDLGSDMRDPSGVKGNITLSVETLRRIDHTPPPYDEVVASRPLGPLRGTGPHGVWQAEAGGGRNGHRPPCRRQKLAAGNSHRIKSLRFHVVTSRNLSISQNRELSILFVARSCGPVRRCGRKEEEVLAPKALVRSLAWLEDTEVISSCLHRCGVLLCHFDGGSGMETRQPLLMTWAVVASRALIRRPDIHRVREGWNSAF